MNVAPCDLLGLSCLLQLRFYGFTVSGNGYRSCLVYLPLVRHIIPELYWSFNKCWDPSCTPMDSRHRNIKRNPNFQDTVDKNSPRHPASGRSDPFRNPRYSPLQTHLSLGRTSPPPPAMVGGLVQPDHPHEISALALVVRGGRIFRNQVFGASGGLRRPWRPLEPPGAPKVPAGPWSPLLEAPARPLKFLEALEAPYAPGKPPHAWSNIYRP